MNTPLLMAIAGIVVPVAWCLLCTAHSHLGGWGRLARGYRATQPPAGKSYWLQNAALGSMAYTRCLTIHASDEGLHLRLWPIFRFAHPPLFLPWSELKNRRPHKVFWPDCVEFNVGASPPMRMCLSAKVFENEPGKKRKP